MTKPIVNHPYEGDKWPHPLMIAQGLHDNPSILKAYLTFGGGQKDGHPVPTMGKLWVFAFPGLSMADGIYTLHVEETSGRKDKAPLVHFKITKDTFDTPVIMWPNDPDNTVQQTFAAWGTSGSDLYDPNPGLSNPYQTMQGGSGPANQGTVTMQPMPSGSNYWTVQFGIPGTSFPNPYTLSIQGDGTTLPAAVLNNHVTVQADPPLLETQQAAASG
jgi:hypothetical protein